MSITPITAYKNSQVQCFTSHECKKEVREHKDSGANLSSEDKRHNRHVKAGVLATTLLSIAAAIAIIAKKQGFSLSPEKIGKTKVKDWAIFKIPKNKKDESKVLKFEEKEILGIAGSSVAGGLIGGAIFDKKENFQSKVREAVNQMLGDVLIPLGFVGGATRIYKSFAKLTKKETSHVHLQNAAKFVAGNKFLRIACPVVISGASLGAGIITGNKVSNYINEKVHNIKVDRKIKATDFAPHLDDVCLAITLMADKSPIGSVISKLVPAALSIAGLEVGNSKKGQHERELKAEQQAAKCDV